MPWGWRTKSTFRTTTTSSIALNGPVEKPPRCYLDSSCRLSLPLARWHWALMKLWNGDVELTSPLKASAAMPSGLTAVSLPRPAQTPEIPRFAGIKKRNCECRESECREAECREAECREAVLLGASPSRRAFQRMVRIFSRRCYPSNFSKSLSQWEQKTQYRKKHSKKHG